MISVPKIAWYAPPPGTATPPMEESTPPGRTRRRPRRAPGRRRRSGVFSWSQLLRRGWFACCVVRRRARGGGIGCRPGRAGARTAQPPAEPGQPVVGEEEDQDDRQAVEDPAEVRGADPAAPGLGEEGQQVAVV